MRKTSPRPASRRIRLTFQVLATIDLLLGVTVLALLLAQTWRTGDQTPQVSTYGAADTRLDDWRSVRQDKPTSLQPQPPSRSAPANPDDRIASVSTPAVPHLVPTVAPMPTATPSPSPNPNPNPSPRPSPTARPSPTPKPTPTGTTATAPKPTSKPAPTPPPTPPGPTILPPFIRNFQQDGPTWTCEAYGREVTGVLSKPEGNGPFPAVIISHGAGAEPAAFCRIKVPKLLSAGYVIIAPTYTHVSGKNDRATYGASTENLNRARTAAVIVHALPYVDKRRVYGFGNNFGAFVTLAMAAELPADKLTAIALTAGGVAPNPGTPMPTEDLARRINCPVLMMHGGVDRTVAPAKSQQLQDILNSRQVPNSRKVFDRADYNVLSSESAEVYRLIDDWFTKYKTPQPRPGAAASASRPTSKPAASSAEATPGR